MTQLNLEEREHRPQWGRLVAFLHPHRPRIALCVGLVIGTTLLDVLVPTLLGRVVDAVAGGRPETLPRWCAYYLAVVGLKSVLSGALAERLQVVGHQVLHELRTAVFGRLLGMPVTLFDHNPTGRLLSRVVNDIKALSELFTASMSVLLVDVVLVVGTAVAMLMLDLRLGAVVLTTLPVVAFSVRYFGRRLSVIYRRVRTRLSEINAFLGENLGALTAIQRLAAEAERAERFDRVLAAHTQAQMQSVGLYGVAMPVTNVLYGLSLSLLLLVGGRRVLDGDLSVGTIVAFAAYLRNLFNPVEDLIQKYNLYLSARVAAERVSGVLEQPTEEDLEGARPLSALPSQWALEFREVGFRYPGQTAMAIDGVSLSIPAGTSLAVVGATGSGKSTLLRLLLKFYDVEKGEIRLGGHPLKDWNRFQLREAVGLVPQEVYLFEGTLRENLSLGRVQADDGYLREQCERVGLWERVADRGGLDFQVREGGQNLSLGERQLITFARAFALNPPVLFLDEATASLDRPLERRLMEAARELLRGRTSIVIAHRLSTVAACDQVVVMEGGRVVEVGTFSELLVRGGVFSRFHELQ